MLGISAVAARPGALRVLFAAAFAAAALAATAAENPCAKAGPVARVDPAGEPGEPLRVTGTVYRADGITPAAGVILFVYQTDAAGYYARERDADPRVPKAERQKSTALGRFAFVRTPRKAQATWEVDWDIRLRSTGDPRLMGLAACGATPAPQG